LEIGMKKEITTLLISLGCTLLALSSCQEKQGMSTTVPMVLDHNRMLVDAEIQRKDGSWRPVRLWIDTGNPDFMMSETLARDLGIDLSAASANATDGRMPPLEVPPPTGVRLGGMALDFQGVGSMVLFEPAWIFNTMHIDANLPSTVMKKYQIVFDYPKREFTIAAPGSLPPRGVRSPAAVNSQTGLVQIDAEISGERFSFALDNGASYSIISGDVLTRLAQEHADWPRTIGAVGCANMWGYWPQEPSWPVVRVPEIRWGEVRLADVGLVGLPIFSADGSSFWDWYSQKTARRVDGFLGPNAFKAFRVEIDFADSAVYFEKGAEFDSHDMDIVGLTLRPDSNGTYQVIGVAEKAGQSAVAGAEPGDRLLQVGDLKTMGATMGTVVDALRGRPGDVRTLVLERNGRQIQIEATVERFL
jgi:hypothetical protein